MKRTLRIQAGAETDIADAVAWYQERRFQLGEEFIDELETIVLRVLRSPLQFPRIGAEVRRALLRRFPYALYFTVSDDAIAIVAVLHQHRAAETWEQRMRPGAQL